MKRCISNEQLRQLTPLEIGKFTDIFGGYIIASVYEPNDNIYMDNNRYGYNSDDICKLFNVGNMIEYLKEKYQRVDIRCELVSTIVVFESIKYDFDYYKYREVDMFLIDALFKVVSKDLKGVNMGTNFYLRDVNLQTSKQILLSKIAETLEYYGLEYLYDALKDAVDNNVKDIHIAKTSVGWKPLFQANERFNSMDDLWEMLRFGNHIVVDEYDEIYDLDKFVERVLKHCPDGKSHSNTFKDVYGYEFTYTEFC